MKNKYIVLLFVFVILSAGLSYLFFSNTNLTKTEAENLVKELPEVQSRLSTLKVVAEDRNDDYWYVQVAEAISDGEINGQRASHTATFNWYKLRKSNGKAVCSMFSYDKNGDLIEESTNSGCI